MRKLFFLLNTLVCCLACYGQAFQLAPPLVTYSSVYFSGRTSVNLRFNEPGTSIHYTLNGTEPTINSPVYKGAVTIKKNTAFRARSLGNSFLPSPVVAVDFVKEGMPFREIKFTKPNEKYDAGKQNILNDTIGGIPNLNNGNWIGYNSDSVVIDISLQKTTAIKKLLIDVLQDQGSWIFLPERIELYALNEVTKQYHLIHEKKITCDKTATKEPVPLDMPAGRGVNAKELRLVLYPVKKIPDWHDGKGNTAWLFIDEINVY
ncbi:MAG: FN3 associated domain-containing protein [Bacteroidota bacterium]